MPIVEVWNGDIGTANVDLLVNASNTVLRLGSGVSGAIRVSAGQGFQEELDRVLAESWPGGLEPGDVVVTSAWKHPRARFVAHVAVMDYREGTLEPAKPTLERIERGARLLWPEIESIGEQLSVGMVALGAGSGGMGLRQSVEAGCKSLRDHLDNFGASNLTKVVFVAYDALEFINTIAVVREFFDIDLSSLPDDARKLLEVVDS